MRNEIKSGWMREGTVKKGGLKSRPSGSRPKPPQSRELVDEAKEKDVEEK